MTAVPSFWKTDLAFISHLAETSKRAEISELCRSAGGRPVIAFSYGERQCIRSMANYSSACGARDRGCYAPIEGKKPVVLLLGAVHGGETEGTAALVNLISLLETGADLNGERHATLLEAASHVRLVIVPVCNPDGRARVARNSEIGSELAEHQYWMQGTWKDGTLCKWPDCKKVHPLKEHTDFLGGYFNDDGVNMMHDNFFRPMAKETQALMDLCDREYADWILQLHGGGNSLNALLQTSYVPLECRQAIHDLALRCDRYAADTTEDLRFTVLEPSGMEHGATPPSFNLASAMHHVCGGVSAVFESNECLVDYPGPHLTHEQVYRSHLILFEQCLLTAAGR